jgi:hypothetical protein
MQCCATFVILRYNNHVMEEMLWYQGRCHAEFCVETIGKETGQDGGMLETSPEHPLQIAVRSWWWQKNPCHSLEAGNYSHITSSPEILTFPASS